MNLKSEREPAHHPMETIFGKKAFQYFGNRERIIRHVDLLILFCFCVLLIFLPIAHTESIRAISFAIPLGLFLLKRVILGKWQWVRTPLDLPILLFSAMALLSLIPAVNFRYSLREVIGEWGVGVLLFYLVVNQLRTDQMKVILGALLLGNLIMVGYGIFEFWKADSSLLDYHWRAASLHSGFGTFSTYLITVLPYILTAFFFLASIRARLLLGILFGLNLFALFFTHSRGAWVALGVLLVMTGWKFLPKKLFLVFLALAVFGLLFLAPRGIFIHYTQTVRNDGGRVKLETVGARWAVTKFVLGKLRENPFRMLGFGRRSFVMAYPDFYLKYKGALLWHAHNTFLDIGLQTGIQGLIFFCFLIYRLLKYCLQKARREENRLQQYYLLATFAMVITFFVRNLSDDFFVDDSALYFWFLSGTVFARKKINFT